MNLRLNEAEIATALLGIPACSNDQAMNGLYHHAARENLLRKQEAKMWLIVGWLNQRATEMNQHDTHAANVAWKLAEELADILKEQGISK